MSTKIKMSTKTDFDFEKTTSASEKPYVILVLQGGGALGAYQIGVLDAMAEAGLQPDWVAGISIGALNSCIIAGNKPEQRLEKLEKFWESITTDHEWNAEYFPAEMQKMYQNLGFLKAVTSGIPGFFNPHTTSFGFNPDSLISYYNTEPMIQTLQSYADFSLINKAETRISVGAANVTTGELVFFDNTKHPIRPEHIMASGSLPPAFPPQRIDGELYWDGGCVSNTPLEVVMYDLPNKPTLIFVVDLWSAYGDEPKNMEEVAQRMNHITYADRSLRQIQKAVFQRNLAQLAKKSMKAGGDASALKAYADDRMVTFDHSLDIVHLVYEHKNEGQHGDADFLHHSIKRRRTAGYRDARSAIKQSPWVRDNDEDVVATYHEVRGGQCFVGAEHKRHKRFMFYGEK